MKQVVAGLVAALVVSGCSFAPEYHRPEQELPSSWGEETSSGQETLSRQWWRRFQDETLNELVDMALAHNRDLEQSLARVEAARMVQRARLYPQQRRDGSVRIVLVLLGK